MSLTPAYTGCNQPAQQSGYCGTCIAIAIGIILAVVVVILAMVWPQASSCCRNNSSSSNDDRRPPVTWTAPSPAVAPPVQQQQYVRPSSNVEFERNDPRNEGVQQNAERIVNKTIVYESTDIPYEHSNRKRYNQREIVPSNGKHKYQRDPQYCKP